MLKRVHLKHRTRSALAHKIIFNSAPKVDAGQLQMELLDTPTVTHADISAWLRAIPEIEPDSPRAAQYIATYDVAGKIARAKAAGTFHGIIAAAGHFIEP